MKEKNYLIIIAHPKKESLNHYIKNEIINSFKNKENIKITLIDLYKDNFNPNLEFTENDIEEEIIKNYQEKIKQTDELIIIFPIWWQSYPAILKGFFDKILTPGFAFEYTKSGLPKKLLKGKKATIIRTFGGPLIYSKFFGFGGWTSLKKGTLNFCGIKIKNKFDLGETNMKSFNEKKVKKFIKKVNKSFLF